MAVSIQTIGSADLDHGARMLRESLGAVGGLAVADAKARATKAAHAAVDAWLGS